MKKRFLTAMLFLLNCTFVTPTQALQIIYTADQLPFIEGYLGGEPNEEVGTREPPFPYFSVGFTINDELASSSPTTVSLNDPSTLIYWPDFLWGAALTPDAPAFITFDSDGSILGWQFSLFFYERGVEPDSPPAETFAWVISNYGVGGDNTDKFNYKNDIYTQRRDTWEYVNVVEVHYAGASKAGNWLIEKTRVPEPNSFMLALFGLTCLIAYRSIKTKKAIT